MKSKKGKIRIEGEGRGKKRDNRGWRKNGGKETRKENGIKEKFKEKEGGKQKTGGKEPVNWIYRNLGEWRRQR